MGHRNVLTEKQRKELTALPNDESVMLDYYVLSRDDILNINRRRGDHNRLGFALQLCTFRYPGRFIQSDEVLPHQFVTFVAAQLGIKSIEAEVYAKRLQTHYEHSISLKRLYNFHSFRRHEVKFRRWLLQVAIDTRNNAELAKRFVEECRKQSIILPGIKIIERMCADARVAAERHLTDLIASRLDESMRRTLHALLDETVDGRLTVYGWLKKFEVGHNSADVNRLLEKLEYLKAFTIPESLLDGVPAHRITWLRQQGEAYYADGLRNINENRRLSILAVCVLEWKVMITDAVLETHDRIVGKIYNDAKRTRDDLLSDQRKLTNKTLTSFIKLGRKLLKVHGNGGPLSEVIHNREALEEMMDTASILTKKLQSDPLEYVLSGHNKLRRYAKRMLEGITFEGNKSVQPLIEAINVLKQINGSDKQLDHPLPVNFANPKWRKRLGESPEKKLWETAVLFTIRDFLRSRDIWVHDSRSYQDTKQQLVPIERAQQISSLPVPLNPEQWISERIALLEQQIKQVNRMIKQGKLPNSCIENGKINIKRLGRRVPEGMDQLTLDVYKQMPKVSITDILREVDEDTGFTDQFTHIHTGSVCSDKVGLLNVLLAGGINMGLKKMALCSSSHTSFWSLMRLSSWHINSETVTDALANIIDHHKNLPLSAAWGESTTSSSDGQFIAAGGTGEALNVINAKYGTVPGLKAYAHVSDQYGPFAMKTIPATAHEAPYILDGLTMNDTGKKIKEHYADTGGFTDHVFAMCSLLGYQFAPRLRNLSSFKLYAAQGITIPKTMKELIKDKANLTFALKQWPDIIRMIASIITTILSRCPMETYCWSPGTMSQRKMRSPPVAILVH